MFKHVLIPTDGSKLSAKAIEYGVALARAVEAKITGLTVTTPFHILAMEPGMAEETPEEFKKHTIAHAAQFLEQIKSAASGLDCSVVHVEHEHPYQAIINTAKARGCDLIAMASHGRRGLSALVLGSETTKVLTHSTIPVLVFR